MGTNCMELIDKAAVIEQLADFEDEFVEDCRGHGVMGTVFYHNIRIRIFEMMDKIDDTA